MAVEHYPSELSAPLREQYVREVGTLNQLPYMAAAAATYFVGSYVFLEHIAPTTLDGLEKGGMILVWLGVCIYFYNDFVKEEEASLKTRVNAMPDDQLRHAHEKLMRDRSRIQLIAALVAIAVAFGLIFTPTGNLLIAAFVEGFQSGGR